jgi:hypothetical protein
MRMLLLVQFPPEPFNTALKNGTAGKTIERILAETKPEAVYFTEQHGSRGCIQVINLEHSSQVPFYAEPWFLNFEAVCELRIAMTPEDLAKAGLDNLGKQWQ